MDKKFPCSSCDEPIKYSASKCLNCGAVVTSEEIAKRRQRFEFDGNTILGCLGLPAIVTLVTYLVLGIGQGDEERSIDDKLIVLAQDTIIARLRDPSSAEFTGVYVSRTAGTPVICGYVNARNGFGGMSGRKRFVTGGVTAVEGDGTMDVTNFQKSWNRLC